MYAGRKHVVQVGHGFTNDVNEGLLLDVAVAHCPGSTPSTLNEEQKLEH